MEFRRSVLKKAGTMANRLREAVSAFLALRHRNPGMFSLFVILGEALLWFLAFPVLPPAR